MRLFIILLALGIAGCGPEFLVQIGDHQRMTSKAVLLEEEGWIKEGLSEITARQEPLARSGLIVLSRREKLGEALVNAPGYLGPSFKTTLVSLFAADQEAMAEAVKRRQVFEELRVVYGRFEMIDPGPYDVVIYTVMAKSSDQDKAFYWLHVPGKSDVSLPNFGSTQRQRGVIMRNWVKNVEKLMVRD